MISVNCDLCNKPLGRDYYEIKMGEKYWMDCDSNTHPSVHKFQVCEGCTNKAIKYFKTDKGYTVEPDE